MNRKEVYEVIDTERDFQESMKVNTTRPDMVEKLSVGATISAIEHNIGLARKAWYHGSEPHEGAMEYLRKVAGLVVQAGEEYGIPERFNHGVPS